MGNKPSHFKGKSRPVERVSWDDCQVFCAKLSQAKGRQFRLPSEAEWEYACRAAVYRHRNAPGSRYDFYGFRVAFRPEKATA
jgi:formylglycine-generating enzyme required for sulfatase activity